MRAALSLLAWACLLVGLASSELAQVDSGGSKDTLEDAASRESGNRLDQKDNTGLPIYTTLNGSVTNLNDILSSIKLNRTQAFLNCSQGSMQVELQFQEPFYGLAYADFDRNSACLTKGRGLDTARIELPLKGCGTIQDPSRVFTNNIVVRFHPFLEMDGDEVITIVCRYPPAIAEPPVIPDKFLPPIPEASTPLLSGFHVLLMICTLLFLTLLLAGLGCSYMCLRGRPVAIIRQTYTGSEITKLSGSSMLSHRSMFDDVFKIPRIMSTQQAYGSEAHLVIEQSDTLPSDYPSESHSEVDEDRSLPVSSAGSYETKALVHQQVEQRASSSLYSETINELESTSIMASRITQSRHPMAVPLEPKFDVSMRVKQAPAAPSPMPSESEASIALERNLTTILEREESTRTIESPQPRLTSFAYAPEIHAPPGGSSRQQTPPVYSRILRKQQAERETVVTETLERGVHTRPRSLASLDTEMTETRSLTEVTDGTHAKYRVANMLAPPPSIHHQMHSTEQYREMSREQLEPLVEPVVSPRRPEITTHEVDDVFLRTVTEKKTIEDIERHRRQVTEYHARLQEQRQQQLPPDPKWDVTIRNYPTQEQQSPPDWENFSDISSASNLTLTNETNAARTQHDEPIDEHIQPTYTAPRSPPRGLVTEESEERSSSATWYNLERVLEPQYATEFTDAEKKKWRQIITTESTLRTLLTEAIVKEDYELIRKDSRYVNLFPPAKWDVIIRIISPPSAGSSVSSSSHSKSGQRYKRGKASEWDNRSRRSSLPTLYEYESDGGSSIRTFGQEQLRQAAASGMSGGRIRKLSSTTRGGSEADLRSMSEMTVRDFARLERDHDQTSLSSFGEGESLVRSLSQPSLARSGSEFTEHWGLPARSLARDWDDDDDDDDPLSSADTTPRATRRELDDSEPEMQI
ncbi:hypothetical protein QAD02_004083 [Eretmocerus hayati]|uniref:Uncharacterized protein n=1 Tax=Eretmocerus hayati TaxID=131215 RepID=A0ACC2NPM3_9HYME|nr:hypothetical protein QAD02_004083 [Eretmocerus hayati]